MTTQLPFTPESGMHNEQRSSKRFPEFLPVEVSFKRQQGRKLSRQNITGRIINLSAKGACILMGKDQAGHCNDFPVFTVEATDDFQMHVRGKNYDCPKISVRPVWHETIHLDGVKICKIGIQFLENLNKSDLM